MRDFPRDAFEQAQSFHIAANTLQDKLEEKRFPFTELHSPYVTTSAFACELYLKARHLIEGKAARGHDLWRLFSKLPSEAQLDIERRHNQKINADDIGSLIDAGVAFDLQTIIKANRDSFARLRYFNEKDSRLSEDGYSGLILLPYVLLPTLEQHILSLRPDWATHRNTPPGFDPADLEHPAPPAPDVVEMKMHFNRAPETSDDDAVHDPSRGSIMGLRKKS